MSPHLLPGSADPEEGENGEDDHDGAYEPNDAVHNVLLKKQYLQYGNAFGSSKADEVENRDDDHDCSDQPHDAVHDVLLLMSEN